jgi:chemotaxis protein MotB
LRACASVALPGAAASRRGAERSPFPSNWELSTARALEVTRLLIAEGVDPHTLSAAGYGEFDPADAPAGRARNRRMEITVQPNIDEIVAVPEP